MSTEAPRFRKGFGRPSKLTPEIKERILSFLKVGSYVETAAAAAGISKDTYYQWLRQGAALLAERERARAKGERAPRLTAHGRMLIEFPDAIQKASAEAELLDLTTIKKASATNWQAAAWRLERRSPERWGRRDFVRQELSGPEGGPVETKVTTAIAQLPDGQDRLRHAYLEKLRREIAANAKN